MIPVYQTIINKINKEHPELSGNCLQATTASLLDLPLERVPHFASYCDEWFTQYYSFLKSKGYEYNGLLTNPKNLGAWGNDRFPEIKDMEGINGYFEASVYSPAYFEPTKYCDYDYQQSTHAVIIDKDFNIVHDPNPNYKGLKEYPLAKWLGYNGIINIFMIDKIIPDLTS